MPTKQKRQAVLVSIDREGKDVRIRLDDAECDIGAPKLWTQKVHVTNKVISEESIREMTISDEELVKFGVAVFARLHAFLEFGED